MARRNRTAVTTITARATIYLPFTSTYNIVPADSSLSRSRVLGRTGINIVTRLMGLVLAAIGFGMMGEGARTLLGLAH